MWDDYIKSSPDEARKYVHSSYFTTFYNNIPPRSDFLTDLKLVKVDVIDQTAALWFKVGEFQTWIAAEKLDGNWVLTLDERKILKSLTNSWDKYSTGKITYYSRNPLSNLLRGKANDFSMEFTKLEEKLGIFVPGIDYYYALDGKQAMKIVGEQGKGHGKGRFRVVKAVETVEHLHEAVHVLAAEIGMVTPFFDEGLACSFEKDWRFKSKDDCESSRKLFSERGLRYLLEGANFNQMNMTTKYNVYGLAQATMRYWLDKFGVDAAKKIMTDSVEKPFNIAKVIENRFEKIEKSQEEVEARLLSICKRL